MQFFKSCAWYEACPLRGRGGRVNKKYLRAYQAATRAKTFPNRLSQLSCICILHYFACGLHVKQSCVGCFYVACGLLSCIILIACGKQKPSFANFELYMYGTLRKRPIGVLKLHVVHTLQSAASAIATS